MGDFCWESSEALSTKLLVVVSLDRDIISDNLKNQKFLFHCHALCEIAWFVDISTEGVRDMVCPELEDDYFEKRVELGDEWIELDRICIDMLVRVSSSYDADHLATASSDLLR